MPYLISPLTKLFKIMTIKHLILHLIITRLFTYTLAMNNETMIGENEIKQPSLCQYTCPNGGSPTKRISYSTSPNGCGPKGYVLNLHIENLDLLTECCNTHDMCYSSCNTPKRNCDLRFRDCLLNKCFRLNVKFEKNETVKSIFLIVF
jgi:hypothetical protein